MRVRLLAAAEQEANRAALWYDRQQPGLANRFLDALAVALSEIEQEPRRFPLHDTHRSDREVRWVHLDRFPYLLVYSLTEEEALVIAVAHANRRPNYWEKRLES